jgi:hypothetical protein
MRTKALLLSMSAAAMLLSGVAHAQQPGMKPMPGREGMPMERQGMMGQDGMMGGGMMGGGMMNMMRGCEMMMRGHGAGHAMPQLPPGNEKLQLQMHAEMMQRMGETLAKYAAQVK